MEHHIKNINFMSNIKIYSKVNDIFAYPYPVQNSILLDTVLFLMSPL